jgi:hypothetical protein
MQGQRALIVFIMSICQEQKAWRQTNEVLVDEINCIQYTNIGKRFLDSLF